MPYSNPPVQNMHPEDVKAAVRKKFGSLAALARQNGVSDSVVRAALIRPQPTGNRIIAKCLELSVHQLWPEWYGSDGQRIPSNDE
ncbi:helix-turn-helix domain-containing protein [Terasakiella pusilla]|jgi:Ner family transcriptional regulator|uniref:helix-turn-helix domain-containing protein n=2 Tax=Terasakiella pusilla TaxID=64973 RepID=UPI003AA95516